jgi:hypothetical protein
MIQRNTEADQGPHKLTEIVNVEVLMREDRRIKVREFTEMTDMARNYS